MWLALIAQMLLQPALPKSIYIGRYMPSWIQPLNSSALTKTYSKTYTDFRHM